jgi:hypothetical protein
VSETALMAREEFPDIKDPLQTALAEVDKVAELLPSRGLEPGGARPVDGSRPAGEPLVARDAYGTRLLLVAPFSYDGGVPDHWYAWDVDLCWIAVVVGAGVFASAGDALREWRDAVGPAASGAAQSPCAAGMTARLLAPACRPGSWRTCCRGGSLANSSASTTGSGAVPATSPDPRQPGRLNPVRRRSCGCVPGLVRGTAR